MSTLRSLLVQLTVAATALVAANVFVQRSASGTIPRRLLEEAERSPVATDLFLGNSTMAAGLDRAAFEAATPGQVPLNLGMGSSSPVEHFLIFQQQARHAGATVVYGFLDTQLTDVPTGNWQDLIGNRAMSYYVDPETAIGFYHADSPLGAFLHRLVGRIPVLAERQAIWAKVEVLRRRLADIGMPPRDTNRFGRAEDFALLESAPAEFLRRCRQATEERSPLTPAVASLMRLARERGSAVVIVEMPMPRAHRDQYYRSEEWKSYEARLIELVDAAGGLFVNAADWVDDDGFADHLHLNAKGARVFSTRMALRLAMR
jgi:hypothetical protein